MRTRRGGKEADDERETARARATMFMHVRREKQQLTQ